MKKVALIFGGEGCEKSVSETSAANVFEYIREYDPLPVGINAQGEWYILRGAADKVVFSEWEKSPNLVPTFPIKLGGKSGFFADGKIIPVDVAIPCLHGDFGEDGVVQGALSAAHIAYIGQDVYASAMCADKAFTKLAAEKLGIPTAKWTVSVNESLHSAKMRVKEKIGFPLFIKPSRLGSSHGAAPVFSEEEFDSAYKEAAKLGGGRVLIEELVDTHLELECAFFEDTEKMFSPTGVIDCAGKFYSFGEKYGSSSLNAATEHLPAKITEKICDYSSRLVNFLGVKMLSRIDFFLTKSEEIYFNEINSFPGMTGRSLYPKMTEEMGLSRGEFMKRLIESAKL